MENTRRSFLKKMTAAGIGTAGLALSSNAAATVTTEEKETRRQIRWQITLLFYLNRFSLSRTY